MYASNALDTVVERNAHKWAADPSVSSRRRAPIPVALCPVLGQLLCFPWESHCLVLVLRIARKTWDKNKAMSTRSEAQQLAQGALGAQVDRWLLRGSHRADWVWVRDQRDSQRVAAASRRKLARAGLLTALHASLLLLLGCAVAWCGVLVVAVCVARRGMSGRRSGVSTTTAVARWPSTQTSGARQVGVADWRLWHVADLSACLLLAAVAAAALVWQPAVLLDGHIITHASPACC